MFERFSGMIKGAQHSGRLPVGRSTRRRSPETAELGVLDDDAERAAGSRAGAQQAHHVRVVHLPQQVVLGQQVLQLAGRAGRLQHLHRHRGVACRPCGGPVSVPHGLESLAASGSRTRVCWVRIHGSNREYTIEVRLV